MRLLKHFLNVVAGHWEATNGYQKIVNHVRYAVPGSRAWPPRDSQGDKHIGLRWDFGQEIREGKVIGRNIVLQANLDASQKRLRDLARKDSHQKLLVMFIAYGKPIDAEEFLRRWEEAIKAL